MRRTVVSWVSISIAAMAVIAACGKGGEGKASDEGSAGRSRKGGDAGGGTQGADLPPTCQAYIDEYECYMGRIPEGDRATVRLDLEAHRASWTKVLTGSAREDSCKTSREILEATLRAMPSMAECLK